MMKAKRQNQLDNIEFGVERRKKILKSSRGKRNGKQLKHGEVNLMRFSYLFCIHIEKNGFRFTFHLYYAKVDDVSAAVEKLLCCAPSSTVSHSHCVVIQFLSNSAFTCCLPVVDGLHCTKIFSQCFRP